MVNGTNCSQCFVRVSPVEWIAADVGFGNAATLRHHFTRVRGVSPQQYRRTFCA